MRHGAIGRRLRGAVIRLRSDMVLAQGQPGYGDGVPGSGGAVSGWPVSAVVAAGVPGICGGPPVAPEDGGASARAAEEAEEFDERWEEAEIAAQYDAWASVTPEAEQGYIPTEEEGSSEAEGVN